MRQLTLTIFFLSVINVSAQNSFTKAVIHKSDGSKVDCFIKNVSDESTQQVFDYSLEKGGATIRIDATSITKVEFEDGMILEKHPVEVYVIIAPSINRRQSDYEFPENRLKGEMMVEKLITGSYSLYQFVDQHAHEHFFYKTKKDATLQRLEYKEYVNDVGEIVNKREYRSQLNFLAAEAGCGEKLEAQTGRAEYKRNAMILVFKKLNACLGENTEVNNKYLESKPLLRLTVNGGAAATSLTISDPSQSTYPGLTAESFSSNIGPLLGVSLEIVPQKRQKNYIVSLDVMYHSYAAKTDSLRPYSYLTGIGEFKFSSFSIAPSVRFRLTKNVIAPFLEAGFSYRFLSKTKDNYYTRNSISGEVKNREIFYGKSNTIGYLAGAGVDFKRFSIHARYTLPANRSAFHYSTIFIMAKFAILGKAE